jgi:hypothetical protein
MEVNDLITMLTDGLDPAEAAVVRKAIERDSAKTRVATLKGQSEYAALEQRSTQLQQELEDQGRPGDAGYRPGAKSYQQWYTENLPRIQKLQTDIAEYQKRHGALDNPNPNPNTNPNTGRQYTEAEIQAMVDSRIQQQYSPRWSDILLSTGNLVQKHMLAGRKNPIDFGSLSKTAAEKYNGNLDLAYEEWDKPEREKVAKAAEESRVEQRVKEELAKRGASANFPAAADFTPGALSQHTKAEQEGFDPAALKRDLAKTWMETSQAA